MHVAVPVTLTGGHADLAIEVTVAGLTNYVETTGGSYGAWTCGSITPMAGNPKIAKVQCQLADAAPADALDLGLNINYVSDAATFTAVLSVLGPALDETTGDDTSTTTLPPRHS